MNAHKINVVVISVCGSGGSASNLGGRYQPEHVTRSVILLLMNPVSFKVPRPEKSIGHVFGKSANVRADGQRGFDQHACCHIGICMTCRYVGPKRKWNVHNGLESMKSFLANGWNFLFNSEVSPLRYIEDASIRHYVLQALGAMWAVSFSIAIGSYTVFAASVVGHAVLIGAAAITAATYTAAKLKPKVFRFNAGRRRDGEHE